MTGLPSSYPGSVEAVRLLNKIVDLIDNEDACDPLDDAIEYAKKAIAALSGVAQEVRAWSPAWSATVHDKIIKRLMADVGMPNSNSLYSAFKQLANELHALAHEASSLSSTNSGGAA
jgi:hypothetical protein